MCWAFLNWDNLITKFRQTLMIVSTVSFLILNCQQNQADELTMRSRHQTDWRVEVCQGKQL